MTHLRRLLTVSHSYPLVVNRRLAQEMARQGEGRWEVTAVSPAYFDTYLRPVSFEASAGEPCRVEVLPAHFTRWIHFMLYGSRLRELLSKPWDMVHGWEEPFIFAGAQIARWTRPDVPLVFRTYQNIDKRYPPPFCWIERYCLSRCAGWQGAGEEVMKTALARGYGRKPHRMIPDGVDTDAFRPSQEVRKLMREQLGFSSDGAPIVGYLARFVPEKGLHLMTRVLDRMTSPWRALFVGEGVLEESLRRWAARYGDRVRIVTGVRHNQVPDYLNAMDILCVPSQTTPHWREQFGRMTVEAFACGLPVVGSDSGEIPHILQDAGVVVGEADEDAWLRAVEDLLESPARRLELSERGLERARRLYAWPVVAKKHLDFFEELLDSSGGPR